MKTIVIKIISGGQTGADQGGLDAAIFLNIPHGGWCPKGRKSENGTIPAKYNLKEFNSPYYIHRTRQNVIDSDATIVFAYGAPKGGSLKTVDFAKTYNRPCLVIDMNNSEEQIIATVKNWLQNLQNEVILNIAGSRGSTSPDLHYKVKQILIECLKEFS